MPTYLEVFAAPIGDKAPADSRDKEQAWSLHRTS